MLTAAHCKVLSVALEPCDRGWERQREQYLRGVPLEPLIPAPIADDQDVSVSKRLELGQDVIVQALIVPAVIPHGRLQPSSAITSSGPATGQASKSMPANYSDVFLCHCTITYRLSISCILPELRLGMQQAMFHACTA